MRPVTPLLTYAGILVAAAGFGVIMFSWGQVAGETAVPLQMPYLLSGGLTGLGLILSGLTLVNLNAKRQDAAARERQLGQVRELLAEIKSLLGGEQPTEPAAQESTATEETDQLPPISA